MNCANCKIKLHASITSGICKKCKEDRSICITSSNIKKIFLLTKEEIETIKKCGNMYLISDVEAACEKILVGARKLEYDNRANIRKQKCQNVVPVYANCSRCNAQCCPTPTNLCNDCVTAVQIICICCGNNFLATERERNHIYGWLDGLAKCKPCIDISNSLMYGNNLQMLGLSLDNNNKISITYEIQEIGHDGYCSDPGPEEVTDEYTETNEYHMLTTINNNVIDSYLANPANPSLINYYCRTSGCSSGGSGYCHINSKYIMKDINIVKIE